MKKSAFIISIAAATMMFQACENGLDTTEGLNTDAISVETTEITTNEATMDDVSEEIDYEVDYFTGSHDAVMECTTSSTDLKSTDGWRFGPRYRYLMHPDVVVDNPDTTYPKTITIDYGEGIELENGRIIAGKIIIVLSARPRTDGAQRTVTLENFSVDSIAIEGNSTHTFNRVASGYQAIISIHRAFTFTFPDGSTFEREANRRREWVSGIDTRFDPSDDIIEISGDMTSKHRNDVVIDKVITKRLVKKGTCRYIVEGTIELSKNGELISTLDYGNGECDNLATITKDGVTKIIRLGKRYAER